MTTLKKEMMQEIRLDNIFKQSANQIYSGVHWSKRKKIKDAYLFLTRAPFAKLKKIEGKVDLQFDFFWSGRALDSSNCFFMAKMIEDCLVEHGILQDDTTKFVGKITIQSHKSKFKDNDYCVIKIT